ncbi:MAG: hypothetical protein V1663_02265 [archaeon]
MKKVLVILLILLIIPSVFAFSLFDFLKNLKIDITGYSLIPGCECSTSQGSGCPSYQHCVAGSCTSSGSDNGLCINNTLEGLSPGQYDVRVNYASPYYLCIIDHQQSCNNQINQQGSSHQISGASGPGSALTLCANQYLQGSTLGPMQGPFSGYYYSCATVPVTQNSYILIVSKIGTGTGTITSIPSGINCGSTCSHLYNSITTVILTASPLSGSTFAGWLGACSGTGTCSIAMNSNKVVSATFTQQQNQCEQSGGYCRDICLQNEEIDQVLSQYCPLEGGLGSGAATQQYCCTQLCQENWVCGPWSSVCVNNQQTRSCVDTNNCGTTNNKPPTTQSCSSSCTDNTINNQCSPNKPYYCSSGNLIPNCNSCGCPLNQNCINNVCINSLTNNTNSTPLNPSINLAPIWSNIPDLTFSLNQLSLQNILNLNNYVTDPESQPLTITFSNNQLVYESNIINCYISNNILNCNPPKNTGFLMIGLKASDSDKTSIKMFKLEILGSITSSSSSGVIGGLSDSSPIAEAGQDVVVYPNQEFILDGSSSYDKENNIPSLPSSYIWYEGQQKLGEGPYLKKSYESIDSHKITLQVTDSTGLSSTDSLNVYIVNKRQCKTTNTVYFPLDTNCDRKWPSNEGEIININSPIFACNLFEVCSDELDYVISDAIDCCDGTILQDSKKVNACNFANQYSSKNAEKCQSLYIIKSLGSDAIYMQDYFEGEMCCYGVSEICENPLNYFTARPIPNSRAMLDIKKIRCYNSPESNKVGEWLSDTKIELNNIALSDVPTHVSVNKLATGTCVDYSTALTTLLRKKGYKKDEVYTVEASTHSYNLVKFPSDNKYTIVDTTGNNDGLRLGAVPAGYEYCKEIRKCYNDLGESTCPRLKDINGCENVREPLSQQTKVIGEKVSSIVNYVYDKLAYEVKR